MIGIICDAVIVTGGYEGSELKDRYSIDSTPRLFADDTCLVVNAPTTELLEQP